MKLRMRADAKDWTIFGIFCVFLLYVVCIFVINFASLTSEGVFRGLNPLPAFTPEFILFTLGFYLLALLASFLSVSSYFFDMEKGIGISSSSKKEKGYSRWAKDKEIMDELDEVDPASKNSDKAGIALISKKGKVWVDNGEYHSLVIGATGSGKTQCVVLPQVKLLAKKKESMIITDPKGEIYEKTSDMLRSRGYNIVVLNFRDPQKGNAWNPMSLPYNLYKAGNLDKAVELLDDLALNILYDESTAGQDPFWEKTSADYFSGITMGLFEDARPEEINISSVGMATTVGEEKSGSSTYVQEYFKFKDPNSTAYINASGTIIAATETKQSILSVFKQKIKLFTSRKNIAEMLSYSDFDVMDIGKKPTAVYIIVQDEKKTYHALATIFIKQCYETLIDVAQRNGGKLPVRTNFLLDEFANMPPLKDITTMITAARSRQIRFTFIIQNFAQLDKVYGKEDAETLKGNCGNIIYLITTELKALEEISKLAGEQKSSKDDKTASTPLVTVSDLQRMKQFDMILLRLRMNPFRTSFVPDFKINWGFPNGNAAYPEREKKKLEVFDIKEFVKNKKKEKMKALMQESTGEKEEERPSLRPRPFKPVPAPKPMDMETKNVLIDDSDDIVLDSRKEKGMVPLPSVSKREDEARKPVDIEALMRKIDAQIAASKEEEAPKEKDNLEYDDIMAKVTASVNQKMRDMDEEHKDLHDDVDVEVLETKKEEPKKSLLDGINKAPIEETKAEAPKEEKVEKDKVVLPEINLDDDDENDDFFDDFFDN